MGCAAQFEPKKSYLLTGRFRQIPKTHQEFGLNFYPTRHLYRETGHLLGSI